MIKNTISDDTNKALNLARVSERYSKDDVMQYSDGWHVCFLSTAKRYVKVSDGFKTKSIAETERKLLNAR